MNIIVIGATGKTGSIIAKEIYNSSKHKIAGLITHSSSGNFPGSDITYSQDLKSVIASADGIIDFSTPDSTINSLIINKDYQLPYVIGTTGFTSTQMEKIKELSQYMPIMQSANFSLGIAILRNIAKKISSLLDNDFDIEIIESHHRHKKDAPSGTALMLFDEIKSVKKESEIATSSRFNGKERNNNEIGISSIRGGNIFGEHEIRFISKGEEIYIGHKAFNREIFAKSAILACEKLVNKEPNLYSFDDIFYI